MRIADGLVVGTALLATQASAGFIKFADWQEMPQGQQSAYVMGAIDALIEGNPYGKRVEKCVSGLGMKSAQLTDNILTYSSANPKAHSFNMPTVVYNYLLSACPALNAKD